MVSPGDLRGPRKKVHDNRAVFPQQDLDAGRLQIFLPIALDGCLVLQLVGELFRVIVDHPARNSIKRECVEIFVQRGSADLASLEFSLADGERAFPAKSKCGSRLTRIGGATLVCAGARIANAARISLAARASAPAYSACPDPDAADSNTAAAAPSAFGPARFTLNGLLEGGRDALGPWRVGQKLLGIAFRPLGY